MLQPSLWLVTGQNAVCYDQVYDLLLVRTLCYDQVYDLLLVRTLYVTTKFMICYWSERCMLDQVYDLLLVKTLYTMTKFMICYWSEHYVTTKFMICYWSKHCMLRPSLWFVTGQNAICYDK
jgi:hypothetical protein